MIVAITLYHCLCTALCGQIAVIACDAVKNIDLLHVPVLPTNKSQTTTLPPFMLKLLSDRPRTVLQAVVLIVGYHLALCWIICTWSRLYHVTAFYIVVLKVTVCCNLQINKYHVIWHPVGGCHHAPPPTLQQLKFKHWPHAA